MTSARRSDIEHGVSLSHRWPQVVEPLGIVWLEVVPNVPFTGRAACRV